MDFNIYDIVKFRIKGENKNSLKYFEREYAYFKTEENIQPDLEVLIGKFTPLDEKRCIMVENKYYIDTDYLFCKDKYKLATWEFCITNIEGKPSIFFNSIPFHFGATILKHYLIQALLGFLLAQKGFSLVKASGVALDGKGVIFPASRGGGKTTTALNLPGIFLGDEYVILSKEGMVYSFPLPIHISNYHVRKDAPYYQKLALSTKMDVKLKRLLYILTLKYANIPTYVEPKSLFDEFGGKFNLNYLILLTPRGNSSVKVKSISEKKEVSKKLTIIDKHQFWYSYEYLLGYSYVFPKSKVASYFETLEQNLCSSLTNTNCYEVEIPSKPDPKTYEEIKRLLS